MVIPRILNTVEPATENTSNTAAVVPQATLAVRNRCSGVSLGVMARKAGAVASGSTITNNELPASRMYSLKLNPASVASPNHAIKD